MSVNSYLYCWFFIAPLIGFFNFIFFKKITPNCYISTSSNYKPQWPSFVDWPKDENGENFDLPFISKINLVKHDCFYLLLISWHYQ